MPFERYADDAVVHWSSNARRAVRQAIEDRMMARVGGQLRPLLDHSIPFSEALNQSIVA